MKSACEVLFVVLLCSLPAAALAGGVNRYVSTKGADTANDCTTAMSPCLTVGHAIGEAASGDVVRIAKGKYYGANSLINSGDLTISGNWNETFTLQSADTATILGAPKTQRAFDVVFDGGSAGNIRFEHLTIAKCKWDKKLGNGYQTSGSAIRVTAYDSGLVDIAIDNVVFKANSASVGGAIYVYGNDLSLSIANSVFVKNKALVIGGAVAMDTAGSSSVSITDSSFTSNRARKEMPARSTPAGSTVRRSTRWID